MGRGGLGVSCENGLAWLQQAAAAVMRTAEAVSSSLPTLSNLMQLACMPHCWGHSGCSRPHADIYPPAVRPCRPVQPEFRSGVDSPLTHHALLPMPRPPLLPLLQLLQLLPYDV